MAKEPLQKPLPSEVLSALRELLLASEVDRVAPILTEMLVLYWPPFRAADDSELLHMAVIGARAYVEDLSEFSPEILKAGWREARRAHKTLGWPTIQVIRDACIAAKPGSSAPSVSQRNDAARIAEFYRSGFWLDTWGPRPVSDGYQRTQNDQWWARRLSGSSPEQLAKDDEIQQRMRNGESASAILREAIGGNDMPLLPAEKISQASAERRRQDSIHKAEDMA